MQNFHIAVPTAFHDDLSVDVDSTIAHIHYLYQKGVRAVMLCGSTGEQHSLSIAERLAILEKLAQANLPNDLTIIFGVAHSFMQEAVKLAEAVERNKVVNALLVGAPPYIRPTQTEFLGYVQAILAKTTKPIILYNNPERTGFNISTDSLLALSQNKQIIGVKDPTDIQNIIHQLPEKWLIFAGGEEDLAEKIKNGFNACSSMAANVLPTEIQSWFNALLKDPTAMLTSSDNQILENIYKNVPLIVIKQYIAEQENLPMMKNHRRPTFN